MACFIRMLIALSIACFCVCSAEELTQGRWAVVSKHRADPLGGKSDEGKNSSKETPTGNKRRRSISPSERTDSVETMNDLRRTVGSSNMPYMAYDVMGESEAASWTDFCDFDRTDSSRDSAFWVQHFTTASTTIPTILRSFFKSYSREMSSVYLRSFGCDLRRCSSLTANKSVLANAQLALCLFHGESQYNIDEVQYKLGEGCSECDSGSFWCDDGLCRDNCSASDSNCYCNSYCLNCADTNRTTCSCQCLEGWTGSRCETQVSVNATKPSCTTTTHVSKTTTTTNPTSAETIPRNGTPIVTSVFQLTFCAVMFLFRG